MLYIWSTHGTETQVRILCSKNRLALLKVTLPRLELIAALVGARLLNYVCRETGYDVTGTTLWSDSTVALGWIRNDPNSWKIFVGNRVTEIHTYTTPSEWKYCPGEDNPADYLSRGLTLRNWNSCEHGGTVLRGCHKTRIIGHANQPENINHWQMRKQFLLVGSTHNSNRLIDSSRFSSY